MGEKWCYYFIVRSWIVSEVECLFLDVLAIYMLQSAFMNMTVLLVLITLYVLLLCTDQLEVLFILFF